MRSKSPESAMSAGFITSALRSFTSPACAVPKLLMLAEIATASAIPRNLFIAAPHLQIERRIMLALIRPTDCAPDASPREREAQSSQESRAVAGIRAYRLGSARDE